MKHLEIENKYILSYNKALKFVKSLPSYKVYKIEQSYLSNEANKTKRVRKIDNKYILTIKKGEGKIKEEREKYISKKRYKKLKKRKIGHTIKKRRYVFELGRFTYELDIFRGSLKGLAYLEIEFKSAKQMKKFTLPKRVKKIVKKDVSGDKRYSNAFLATNVKNLVDLFDKPS